MSKVEFEFATWRELSLMLEQVKHVRQEADYRAGVVASIMANAHRGKGHSGYKPGDFFPSLKREPEYISAETAAKAFTALAQVSPDVVVKGSA